MLAPLPGGQILWWVCLAFSSPKSYLPVSYLEQTIRGGLPTGCYEATVTKTYLS